MNDPLSQLVRDARCPHRSLFLRAGILAAAASIAAIALLALSGWFIVGAAMAGLAGIVAVQSFNYLLPSAMIRLLAIVRTAARYGERLLSHQAALRTLADLRVRLFKSLIAADVAATGRSSGDSSTQLIHDVAALEDQMVRAPTLVGTGAGLALVLLLVFMAAPLAALTAFFASALSMLLADRLARSAALAQDGAERAMAQLRRELTEQVAAAGDIAAYGLADRMCERMMAVARDGDAHRLGLVRVEVLINGLANLTAAAVVAVVLLTSSATLPTIILGALAAAGGGELLATVLRGRMVPMLRAAGTVRLSAIAAQQATPDSDSLNTIASPASIILPVGEGSVSLRPGYRIAIIGASGSGKTRLLETLAGWRDDALAIAIDDAPLRPGQAASRRWAFALAPQDAAAIAGTIADNLRIARPGLDDTMLWSALETACLADTVRAMPQGLDTWIGDGGTRLSGGERKRLSIARALLADRPWLLLDEPSEGLDMATEARLCQRLALWLDAHGAGLLLVTHRPAMLALARDRYTLRPS